MTGVPALDIGLAVLGALATVYGLWAGARKALADARKLEKPPPVPYEALAARVSVLEQADSAKSRELARINRLLEAISYRMAHVLDWIEEGAQPPPPHEEISALRGFIQDVEAHFRKHDDKAP